jgi:hypothetical protein
VRSDKTATDFAGTINLRAAVSIDAASARIQGMFRDALRPLPACSLKAETVRKGSD